MCTVHAEWLFWVGLKRKAAFPWFPLQPLELPGYWFCHQVESISVDFQNPGTSHCNLCCLQWSHVRVLYWKWHWNKKKWNFLQRWGPGGCWRFFWIHSLLNRSYLCFSRTCLGLSTRISGPRGNPIVITNCVLSLELWVCFQEVAIDGERLTDGMMSSEELSVRFEPWWIFLKTHELFSPLSSWFLSPVSSYEPG